MWCLLGILLLAAPHLRGPLLALFVALSLSGFSCDSVCFHSLRVETWSPPGTFNLASTVLLFSSPGFWFATSMSFHLIGPCIPLGMGGRPHGIHFPLPCFSFVCIRSGSMMEYRLLQKGNSTRFLNVFIQ